MKLLLITVLLATLGSWPQSISATEEQVTPIDQYKDEPNDGNNVYFSPALFDEASPSMDSEYDDDIPQIVDEITGKRSPSWTNLRVGAGKRSPAWNNLRAGAGKRTPSWNNLRIGSGKRLAPDERDWNKLSGLIGKRSIGWNRINSSWGKRDPRWTTMSSNWGKRGWNDMNTGFGKRNPIAHWNNMRGMWGK